MSSTAYNQRVDGAAAFTGTSPTSVLDTALPDLDDFDQYDRFKIQHTGLYLNATGDPTELQFDLLANETVIYTAQFGSIGSDANPRDVILEWDIVIGATDTAAVKFLIGSVSTAGAEDSRGEGPALRPRSTIWRAQPFVSPVTLDIQATLDTNDVDHTYTPDETFVHKYEPTLSSGAGVAGVVSVNAMTGTVTLTAANLGFVPIATLPPGAVTESAGSYPARPSTFSRVLYFGADQPTASNTPVGESFQDGYDIWVKLP